MTPETDASGLDPSIAQRRAQTSAQLMLRFGEIVSVLMRAPSYRELPLSALEDLVMPPLLNGQILVAEGQSQTTGLVAPLAIGLWARVSEEVDQRLSSDLDQPIQLAHSEWNSGDFPWLIILEGDSRLIAPMIKSLQQSAVGGKPVKMRSLNEEGKQIVNVL